MNRDGFVAVNKKSWPVTVDAKLLERSTSLYDVLVLDSDTLVWRSFKPTKAINHVSKLYYGRGMISWLREHLFAFRVEREYQALAYLANAGVPCSLPVSWTKGEDAALGGRFEVLTTVEIPNAISLAEIWNKDTFSQAQKLQCVNKALVLIRQMHEAGLHHGAMYIRNILFEQKESGALKAYIIDLPRAIACHESIVGDSLATIDLLHFIYPIHKELSADGVEAGLIAYGFNVAERAAFTKELKAYKPSKHRRNMERAYGTWRHLLISRKLGANANILR